MKLAEKEGIVIFPKSIYKVYDKTLSIEHISSICLSQSETFPFWIATEGIQQGNLTVIKHFDELKENWIKTLKLKVLFENYQKIDYL